MLRSNGCLKLTFILANVFEGKSQSRVLTFNNADFAESTLAHNSEEAEVVEVYYPTD